MIQRDMPPNIKRVVQNLTCQEHKFMYCPSCKNFNDIDFNPMENIEKFMAYMDQEEKKWVMTQGKKKKKKKVAFSPNGLVDDSCSDITDFAKEEILTRYYKEVLTQAELHNKERKKA